MRELKDYFIINGFKYDEMDKVLKLKFNKYAKIVKKKKLDTYLLSLDPKSTNIYLVEKGNNKTSLNVNGIGVPDDVLENIVQEWLMVDEQTV